MFIVFVSPLIIVLLLFVFALGLGIRLTAGKKKKKKDVEVTIGNKTVNSSITYESERFFSTLNSSRGRASPNILER